MNWILTSANIALTYTCIMWERECGGVKQTLTVFAWNHNEMSLEATMVWAGEIHDYRLDNIPRDYINDGDVTNYFNKTVFKGERV